MIKKFFIPVLGIVVASGTLIAASTHVQAISISPAFSGLAQVLAQKFNLNQSDVQNAISSYMSARRQNRLRLRLDALVTQGKITNAQEAAIITELSTIQGQVNLRTLTPAARKQAMLDRKNALSAWAKSQGIDPLYVMPFGNGRMHRGRSFVPTPNPTP